MKTRLSDLEAVLEALRVLVFTFDEQDRFVEYRAADEGDLALPPAAFLGRRPDEVLPPPIGGRLLQGLRDVRAGAQPGIIGYTLDLPVGRCDFEARLVPLAGGRVAALVLDVSDRTRAEREARESGERFQALLERATDLLAVLHLDGRVAYWSPGTTAALGWTAGELAGRSGLELVHPEDATAARAQLAELAAAPGVTRRLRVRARHRDGRWRVLDAQARNLAHVPAVGGIVVNARDVTDEVRLEEQVREAQRLDSVGRLAGGVAHDFNNLLTVILSCVESLQAAAPAGAAAEDAREIALAAERARELTRQLLAFARRQVIAPRPVDLNALVAESERLLRRVLGEGVALSLRLAPEPAVTEADPTQLQQVLLNLAVNARDAMPRGGTLEIEVAPVRLDDPPGGVHPELAAGRYVRLSVTDTGEGMSAEARAHAFEPFFTTKPAGRGTGLGLAMVYGIVKQSGGHVSLATEPGQGTRFEIHLPGAEAAAATSSAAAAVPAPARGTETVLVLEDDPRVRDVTVRALRAAGYRILAAGDGAEALAVAGAADPPVRLLVSDVVLAGASGRDAAEELGRRVPGLKVLYVSGYTPDTIVHHGVLDEGVEFLAKPFTGPALVERVRAILDRPPGA